MSIPTEYLAQITLETSFDIDERIEQQIFVSHNVTSDAVLNAIVQFGSTPDADGYLPITGGALKGLLDLLGSEPGSTATSEQINAFMSSFNQLRSIVLNGVTTNGKTEYVTVAMARDIELLFNSVHNVSGTFSWAGVNAVNNMTAGRITQWRDLTLFNSELKEALSRLINSGLAGKVYESGGKLEGSIQAFIELIYIKSANEMLSDNLVNLEEALQTTKNAIDSLASLQQLHNNVTVVGKGPLPYQTVLSYTLPSGAPPNSESTMNTIIQALQTGFEAAAKAHFGVAPAPIVAPALQSLDGVNGLLTQRDQTLQNLMSVFTLAGGPLLIDPASQNAFFTIMQKIKAFANGSANYPTASGGTSTTDRTLLTVDEAAFLHNWNIMASNYNIATEQLVSSLKALDAIYQTAGVSSIAIAGIDIPIPLAEYFNVRLPTLPFDLSSLTLSYNATVGGVARLLLPGPNNPLQAQPFRQFAEDMIALSTASAGNWLFRPGLLKSTLPGTVLTIDSALRHPNPSSPANPVVVSRTLLANVVFGNTFIQNGVPGKIGPHPLVDFVNKFINLTGVLESTIEELSNDPNQVSNPSSLLSRLQTVLTDINSSGYATTLAAFEPPNAFNLSNLSHRESAMLFAKQWLIDGNDDLTQGISEIGRIQDNIGFAVSAGQSLNDTQKEETRRALFLFEEYYKSAAAILNKITQILEKIAQGVSR